MGLSESKVTIGNGIEVVLNLEERPHFPSEGVCIGKLTLDDKVFPALIDLLGSNGFCFLYNSPDTKRKVNNCLERIAWRLALSLPNNLCEFFFYNGSSPGENFNSIEDLDKSFFRTSVKVLFDADSDLFYNTLSSFYKELASRFNYIKRSGKQSLFELNECEGDASRIKYSFIFISDFQNTEYKQKEILKRIIQANCSKSGIFVFLSNVMSNNQKDEYGKLFDYSRLLSDLTLLLPVEDRFFYKNCLHEDLLNRFALTLDGEDVDIKQHNEWSEYIKSRLLISNNSVSSSECFPSSKLWVSKSIDGLSIPIGKVSSTIPANIEFCPPRDATLVHGLICGTSGSGKSTLLHDIIINAAWLYSPDEIQFILLDFKSVEFGIYSGLPHIRVLSTKSDREYGANVLDFVCKEIEFRKKLFGRHSNIDEYNKATLSDRHIPRIVVIIDEFHNLFIDEGYLGDVRDFNITSHINKSFSKILKEGRAFGIHLLLATQEIDKIASIDSFLQQIKIRIALKLENKGKLLSQDNSATPEKLPRGVGILNDDFGNEGANTEFKYFFFKNGNKDHKQYIEEDIIDLIRKKCKEVYGTYAPTERILYRGGGESVIEDNKDVVTDIHDDKCVVFVGSPVAVAREDISFELKRRRGSNILIIGSYSTYLESLLHLSLNQMIRQSGDKGLFFVCQSDNDEVDLKRFVNNNIIFKDNKDGLFSAVDILIDHLDKRMSKEESISDRVVLAIVGVRLFNVKKSDYELKLKIKKLLCEGPENGIHVLLHASRLSDYKSFFEEEIQLFDETPSLSAEDLMREFSVKVELKGVDSYELYPNSDKSVSPQEDFFANIQTRENGPIIKFSIYQH